MAKNSMKQIKKDEKRILQELVNNSNKSVNEIAKKCGFSRQKVWRIIKGLEKNNTIWGYTTVIDEEKQDLKNYTVLIKRTNKPLDKSTMDKLVERQMEQMAEKIGIVMKSSCYVHGEYDWMIHFIAEDTKAAKRFCEALNITYQGYVSDIKLLESLFISKKNGIQNPNMPELREFFAGI